MRPLIVAGVWVLAALAVFAALAVSGWWIVPAAVLGGLAALGTWDLLQTRHTILRVYPILGHVRFLMELIRPEIRQYFIESNTEAAPFDRETRDLVYERAKATKGDEPFGTERDVNAIGYEFLRHSIRASFATNLQPRVRLGGPDCAQPYDIALLNVSAMSFGALSAQAIEALSGGAARGGFAHDTGEGGISPYHLRGGADLIWEIGSGYFGCRDADGRFDAAAFAERARLSSVRAVSIKLSQGAKPGLGGVLPGAKVTPEIAATRGVPVGLTVVSPPAHSAFSTPTEFVAFIATLRRLSGGKPIGFKLCVGARTEFLSICKAIIATGIAPDFVIVDGGEGGTGAAPQEFEDHVGMPLTEGLMLVHNALVGTGLARPHPHRGVGQGGQRCRHRQPHLSGRGLHHVGAGDDVRGRLHPGAEVQHQPLPHRCRHPGPRPRPCPGRAGQGHQGVQLPAGDRGQCRPDRGVDGPGRIPRAVPGDAEPPR